MLKKFDEKVSGFVGNYKKGYTTGIIAIVLIAAMICGLFSPVTVEAAAKTTKIRVMVDGQDYYCKATKKNKDWYVKVKDIKKILKISKPAGKKSGKVSLDAVAKKADINYECDLVLDAAYFWTELPYGDDDYARAFDLGLASEEYKAKRDSYITSTQFRSLLIDLIKKLDKSKVPSFTKNVTDHRKTLLGGEAVGMAYYAARVIGADDIDYSTFDSSVIKNEEKMWDDRPFSFDKLFPNFFSGKVVLKGDANKWDCDRVAMHIWLLWHVSDFSGEHMVTFDYDKGSFHLEDKVTYGQAIAMLARLYDSSSYQNDPKKVKISDSKALEPDPVVISQKLRDKLNKKADSLQNVPRLTGMVLGSDYNMTEIPASVTDLKIISDWGFNSVRLMLTYQTFFDKDVTKVDLTKLRQLDEIVAAAMRYDLHLNVVFMSLPGRWNANLDDFTREGSFDMFVNDKHLKQAGDVWSVIAERYRDIPAAYLSFSPLWEALNPNLSTGCEAPEYTWEDARDATIYLIDRIRKKDGDRFIIFEPTANNPIRAIVEDDHADQVNKAVSERFDNVRMMSNFCEWAYVYQEMTMTEGKDIDLYTHGMYKQGYPTYIYAAAQLLGDGYPDMVIDGFLPKGTKLEMYIQYSGKDTTYVGEKTVLTVSADGGELCSETMPEKRYELTTEHLSAHYPYAESEKKISVTLPSKTEKIVLHATGYLELCGINVILPKKYAVKSLYYPSQYDYASGLAEHPYQYMRSHSDVQISPNTNDGVSGYHITINKDVSFTSDSIHEKSDSDSIAEFFEKYSGYFSDAAFRFEGASFSLGTTEKSMIAYYTDLLSNCKKYGYSWYSAIDYNDMFANRYSHEGDKAADYERYDSRSLKALGLKFVRYRGKYLESSVIKCLQKFRSKERVPLCRS